jgi:threonine/homoserine/homoserine lactone efflux protein
MWSYLGWGLSMGLSAGISPGPLLALVVAASLRSGLAGGLRVAVAPFLTDVPIVVLSVLLIDRLPPESTRWIGTAGGLVVIWIGVGIIRSTREAALDADVGAVSDPRRELWRGMLVNALNPHPYLFWTTVGGPTLVKGWNASPWYALAFLVSFYLFLVGAKVVVAWLVSRQAGGLPQLWYRRVLISCSLLMFVLGGVLIYQAWTGPS